MVLGWIIGVIIVIVAIAFIVYYNRFVVLGNRIDNSLSQIDVQLHKRADLVPNLVKTVQGYAKHEKGIINDATLSYNNSVESFPGVFFAKIYGAKEKEYLKIPTEAKAVVKVEF